MSVGVELHHHINVAIGAEVFARDGAKQGQLKTLSQDEALKIEIIVASVKGKIR